MNLPKLPAATEPFFWGAVSGAIALAIVGFTWGGWVTGGKAEMQALTRADAAAVASLVPICVHQFKKNPDIKVSLAKLKDIDTWQQTEFVVNGGWATMPGAADKAEPNRDVATGCAEVLNKLVL